MLLWTKRENVDEKDTIAKITENAIDIINKPEARYPIHILFVQKTFTELSRHKLSRQHFKIVESLSLAMLRNVNKHGFRKEWTTIAGTFLIYSYIGEFRFALFGSQER